LLINTGLVIIGLAPSSKYPYPSKPQNPFAVSGCIVVVPEPPTAVDITLIQTFCPTYCPSNSISK
jgi:hypothetical protein